MKKIGVILFSAIMLVSCSKQTNTNTSNPNGFPGDYLGKKIKSLYHNVKYFPLWRQFSYYNDSIVDINNWFTGSPTDTSRSVFYLDKIANGSIRITSSIHFIEGLVNGPLEYQYYYDGNGTLKKITRNGGGGPGEITFSYNSDGTTSSIDYAFVSIRDIDFSYSADSYQIEMSNDPYAKVESSGYKMNELLFMPDFRHEWWNPLNYGSYMRGTISRYEMLRTDGTSNPSWYKGDYGDFNYTVDSDGYVTSFWSHHYFQNKSNPHTYSDTSYITYW